MIESHVCKSNKKAKKRYNKIKNGDEFYIKHVWQGDSIENSETIFLTQLESILKAVNEQEIKKKEIGADSREYESDENSESD
jgi:hypothetical protein